MQKILDQSHYFCDLGNLTLLSDSVLQQAGPTDAFYTTDVSVKTDTGSFMHRQHVLCLCTAKYICTSIAELILDLVNLCLNPNPGSTNL